MSAIRIHALPSDNTPQVTDYILVSQSGVEKKLSLADLLVYLAETFVSTGNNLSELAATAATARGNINAAVKGVNDDITELTGLTTPLSVAQGGTGVTTSTGTGSAVLSEAPTINELNLTGELNLVGSPGAPGNQLTSTGPGTAPVWSPPSTSFNAFAALGVLAFLNQ